MIAQLPPHWPGFNPSLRRCRQLWTSARPSGRACATAKIRTSKRRVYGAGETGIVGARQLHGKELSYNNLVDLDAAWALVAEFARPAVAIIKHTNPAGCAEQAMVVEAYRKALECDPISAFGGVVGVNREVDEETAQRDEQAVPGSDRGARVFRLCAWRFCRPRRICACWP